MARSVTRRRKGLFGRLQSIGINRGLYGNSRSWFYVGAGLWTIRTLRRVTGRKAEVLVSEELKPGQRLVIANGRATVEGDVLPVVRGRGGRLKRRKG